MTSHNHPRESLTPLLLAAKHGSWATLRVLMEAGAVVTAMDSQQRSALFLSVVENHLETLKVCKFVDLSCYCKGMVLCHNLS